nr:MAG TPA: DNA polymerase [Bacteriophage sp.]
MRVIRNVDVGSYYPHLVTNNGYASRNMPNPQIYADMLERRMAAKAAGDKPTANALKLVCNTTYGAMLNTYNNLYDPLMGRSVCISGQLYLLELAKHCLEAIPSVRVVQLNTDGLMVSLEDTDLPILDRLKTEWETRTGFSLEVDEIERIYQKDVNNYIAVYTNGKVKTKGGYLTYGVSSAGAWKVNNDMICVRKAIIDYFVKGASPEDTINSNDNLFDYQLIAKAGSKYSESYQIVDGAKVPIQKVNRVYATANERYGTLYKTHGQTGRDAKIEGLPEHCIVDNDNHLTIQDVDKSWYIALAKKRINDFMGIKEKKGGRKKLAETKKPMLNIYAKLNEARLRVLKSGMKKSGKNMHLSYKYFELEDIVPVVTPIFNDLGLLAIADFGTDVAYMTVIDCDAPDDRLVFSARRADLSSMLDGKNKAVTPLQLLGSEHTYLRRYLYMMALDIVENDEMEGMLGEDDEPEQPVEVPKRKIPPTPEQRQEIKQELTNPEGKATDLQIKQLKEACAKLLQVKADARPAVEKWALESKGFTEMTKAACEKRLIAVSDLLAAAEKGA